MFCEIFRPLTETIRSAISLLSSPCEATRLNSLIVTPVMTPMRFAADRGAHSHEYSLMLQVAFDWRSTACNPRTVFRDPVIISLFTHQLYPSRSYAFKSTRKRAAFRMMRAPIHPCRV